MKSNSCIVCHSIELKRILSIGDFPPANLLTEKPNEEVSSLDLNLMYCTSCGHLQQEFFYDEKELFSNYLYQSSTSKTLDDFFKFISDLTISSLDSGSSILEIACNDGIFLEKFKHSQINTIGVEPAINIAQIATDKGLNVINSFWPVKTDKKFDAIFAFNVLAHGPQPMKFFESMLFALDDKGFLAIQVSQINILSNYEFDTVYHEHFSFFTKSSLHFLATKYELNLNLFHTNIHGGSGFAIYTRKNMKSKFVQTLRDSMPSNFLIEEFNNFELPSLLDVEKFSNFATDLKINLNNFIERQKKQNKKIVLVGAAAKAITVLYFSNLEPDYVVDEAPLKINKYIPSTNIKIDNFNTLNAINEDCAFIIGAWNFFDELTSKIKKIRPPERFKDVIYTYYPKEIEI